jgi:hypothetical protein
MRGCTVSHAAFELHKAAASGAITLTSESPKVPPANKTKLYLARSVNKQQQSQPAVRFFLIISVFNRPLFWSLTDDDTHLQTLFARPVRGNWGFSSGGTFALRAGGRSARVLLRPHHLVRFLISGPHKVGGRCCLMWPQGNTFRHEIPAQMSLTARRPLVSAVAFYVNARVLVNADVQ